MVLAAGLLQALMVIRFLGPREYGIVALAMAGPTLLFTIFDPQASESVVRYTARYLEEEDHDRAAAVSRLAYAADGVLALAGLAVVVAAAPWAAEHVLQAPGSAELVVAYAVGLTAGAPISTSRAVLTSFDRFRLVATVTSLATVLRTGIVIVLVGLGWGASGVIYGSVAGLVLEGVMIGVAADRALRARTGRSWRSVKTTLLGAERRNILSFMLHTELASLAGALVKHADVLILGAARGPAAAGHYRLAWQLVAPVISMASPLQQVFYPRAARLAVAGDWPGFRALIRRQMRSVGLPLAALVIAAIPLVVLAIPHLAGADYAAATAPAALLLLGAAAGLALFWVRSGYLASGHVRALLVVSTLTAFASVVGFLVAAPTAGAAGVAGVRALVTGLVGGGAGAAYLLRKVSASGGDSRTCVPRESVV